MTYSNIWIYSQTGFIEDVILSDTEEKFEFEQFTLLVSVLI